MVKFLDVLRRLPSGQLIAGLRQQLFNRADHQKQITGPADLIAVQCVPDALYFGLLAGLVADIRDRANVTVDLVIVRSTSAAFGFTLWSEIKRNSITTWIRTSKWHRCFGSLADGVAYRSSSWRHPISDATSLWRSFHTWRRWRSKPNEIEPKWADETIDGVVCGDLIVDTFLRFRPAPRFDVNDPFVWRVIWQAMRDIYRARRYFRSQKPKLYLTSYATYVEHGIAVRVAIQENVTVYCFGNLSQFGKRLTGEHLHHTVDSHGFRKAFDRLDPELQQDCLRRARDFLDYRVSGGIDSAIAYMRNSAYATTGERPMMGLKGAVAIFLHDFYDSPNAYPDFVFTDFWDWVTSTIDALAKADIPFVLKPHPNQILLSDAALGELRKKYPEARWLDSSTNNVDLVSAGIACGVTVYGTVANELAYLGVPSICAAAHPHQSFDFCRTAHSRREHEALLAEPATRPLEVSEMKLQALQFYAMKNNLHDPIQAELGNAFTEYYIAAVNDVINDTSVGALAALRNLRSQPGYIAFIQNLDIGASQLEH